MPLVRHRRIYVLALLILVAIAAVAAVPPAAAQAPPAGTWQAADCFVPPPDGFTVDCGYVIAPESHTTFDGDVVALATVIIHSPNPDGAPDPVVYLAGGPGGSAARLAPAAPYFFEHVLAKRDLILFDQRGTGFSEPGLFCPPLAGDTVGGTIPIGAFDASERPAVLQQQVELYTACGKAYQAAGVDLASYNTPENAADIEDLRRALGYTQLNLYGGSYGTRLALEAMRFRPATIRSVVLESVVPPTYAFQVEAPAAFNRALEGVFAACAGDVACNAAYPGLGQRWDSVIAGLNAAPVQLPIVNLETQETIDYLPVNGWDLTNVLFSVLYDTAGLPIIPLVIGEASKGNVAPLSTLFSALLQPGGDAPAPQAGVATTMFTATQCYDDMPFVSAADFVRVRDQNRRGAPLSLDLALNEAFKEVCANLGLGTATPAFENQPVSSDVPSLVIAGELDPIAPQQQAYEAAATLPNSSVVVYPRGGHGPSQASACLRAATAAFFDNPLAKPDTSCIAREGPLPFVVEAEAATVQALSVERGWLPALP